jgi:hypothetical protein
MDDKRKKEERDSRESFRNMLKERWIRKKEKLKTVWTAFKSLTKK